MNNILEELSSCGLLCAALVVPMAEGLFARKSVGLAEAAVSSSLAVLSTVHLSIFKIQAVLAISIPCFTFKRSHQEIHGLSIFTNYRA